MTLASPTLPEPRPTPALLFPGRRQRLVPSLPVYDMAAWEPNEFDEGDEKDGVDDDDEEDL